MSAYARAVAAISTWYSRAALRVAAALRRPPPQLGFASGRVASGQRAERDLRALATSPTTYAAVTRRALSLTTYPIRVYQGYAYSGHALDALDPATTPWVASLLRLLQTPNETEGGALFPEPGEALIAQIAADLILTGNFWVAPVLDADGRPIGLHRLHPRCVTIERAGGVEEVVYRSGFEVRRYPRREVSHGHLLSWEASGQSTLGTGAGSALEHLVAAEARALEHTATVIEQGGADLRVVAKSAAAMEMLKDPRRREELLSKVVSTLATAGRRVFLFGGDVTVEDAGFKPADLQAPELLAAASRAELVAAGCVPVAVGAEAGTYATAVQQYRVQAEQDEAIAGVIEAALLRPLARRFAALAGGMVARRPDTITCRIDLGQHPGYAYLRTDAINRMRELVAMGWLPDQAAEIEGLDLPEPLGEPSAAPAQAPGPAVGSHKPPRRPVGDAQDPNPNQDPNAPRSFFELLRANAQESAEIAAK